MRGRLTYLILFWVATLVGPSYLSAQHSPLYNQFYFNPLAVNPATAGSEKALSLVGTVNKQWVGFPGAPLTANFAAHTPLNSETHHLGLLLGADRLGVTQQSLISGAYAYRIHFGASNLAFGLSGGIAFRQDRWSQVQTTQAGDDAFSEDSPIFLIPRVGFGTQFNSPRFKFGFSLPQLVQYRITGQEPDPLDLFAQRPLLIQSELDIPLNPFLNFQPAVQVRYLRQAPAQMDLLLRMEAKEKISFGLGWRSQESLFGLLQMSINPQFSLAYAYNVGLGGLARYHSGSHELGLRYTFRYQLPVGSFQSP